MVDNTSRGKGTLTLQTTDPETGEKTTLDTNETEALHNNIIEGIKSKLNAANKDSSWDHATHDW